MTVESPSPHSPSPHYIYLHGFASSPQSAKAKYLRDRFHSVNHVLELLDLNQNDFSHLTLSRQIRQVQASLPPAPTPVTLIGSSFGGLTAAWVAERCPQVERLVLLAPAFGFPSNWLDRLSPEQWAQWRRDRYLPVHHYGAGQSLPLHYDFVTDALKYAWEGMQRSLPTLIVHGIQDDVIPVQMSQAYAQSRPWVQLITLDSDHALGNAVSRIWQATREFCGI